MLHNAPSLDLSSIILLRKKSRKIGHASWIATELIRNLIFSEMKASWTRANTVRGGEVVEVGELWQETVHVQSGRRLEEKEDGACQRWIIAI